MRQTSAARCVRIHTLISTSATSSRGWQEEERRTYGRRGHGDVAAAVERRAGDDVRRLGLGGVRVDVDVHARVAVAVGTGEADELSCSGRAAASAGDLDLGALGVELLHRTGGVVSGDHTCAQRRKSGDGTHGGHRVERDGLEADEVVAGGDRGRDRRRPGRVVGDHLAVGPRAAVDGAGEEPGLVDLEPLERVRVHTRARRAGALGEVRQLESATVSLWVSVWNQRCG